MRITNAALLLLSTVTFAACAAPTTEPGDDAATTSSAVGAGGPALRRNFAGVTYGRADLASVQIMRTEHDSTAGRGNWVRYWVTGKSATASSATCAITQVSRDLTEKQASSALIGAADGTGTFTLAHPSQHTYATYAIDEVATVDFDCVAGGSPYFHVQCHESTGPSGAFDFACDAASP